MFYTYIHMRKDDGKVFYQGILRKTSPFRAGM